MKKYPFDQLSENLSSPRGIITDLKGYEDYFHDATESSGNPSAIIIAENEGDIIATVKFCSKHDIPLVARGAGTGLSGGCVPTDGAVVLSLEKLTGLIIDSQKKIGYVQSGVITKALIDIASEYNLTYLPDPASYEESTLGGNVAENAGGLRCVRYGVTSDYVLGIKGITTKGEIIKTGVYGNGEGFNLTDIFIGSEGTLIIITEIALKLSEIPQPGITILVAFEYPQDAAQTVSDICRRGITPSILEYLDGDAAACSNKYEKADGLDDVSAILIIEIDYKDSEIVEKICQSNRCSYIKRESEPAKTEQLWKIRRNLSYAVKEIAKIRISEDVAVPISKFPELVSFVAEMNRRSSLRINSFGHAGDGNLHVNFLSMSGSDGERELIEREIEILLKKTIELGGTLTGEHGIGLAKKKYLPLEFDPATLKIMKQVKEVFNEQNILNPNKIF